MEWGKEFFLSMVVYGLVQCHHYRYGYGMLKNVLIEVEKVSKQINANNEANDREIIIEANKLNDSFQNKWGGKEIYMYLFLDVQRKINDLNLSSERKNTILKIIRAKHKAEIKTRPLLHAIGMGAAAVLISSVAIISTTSINEVKDLLFCKVCYFIIAFSFMASFILCYAVSQNARSVVIIDAIDDILEKENEKYKTKRIED